MHTCKYSYSPGPWISCSTHVDNRDGVTLFRNARDFEDMNCNDFHLAAAAPELFKACAMLVAWHALGVDAPAMLDDAVDAAKEAVEKYLNRLED